MDESLIRYIWRHTSRQQLWVLFVVLASMVPYFMSFDLPKQIVNGPIQGSGFESPDATQLFGRIAFSLPLIGQIELFPGVELGRMNMLFGLSFVFLGLVIINGLFKFYINTYKGRLGERLLRRIRFELIDRVLRFPPTAFKRLKGAEIASMIKDEVEPLGGFTGDAFVTPVFLGGQALTALVFIFMQNLWLGLITAFMVGVQAILIPRLRKRLLILGRERQLTARELAGRVGEIVDGIGTIHAYDTTNYERADVSGRLGRIFQIRYDLYQWKFMVKFINNFLSSLTPFLFYSVGGYLALQGRLDIGQLVAVIAAYKDLPGPLNDLIAWDQARQDVQIKYAQVAGVFAVEPMIDEKLHEVNPEDHKVTGPLAAVNLTVADEGGATLIDHVNLRVQPGERVAIVGGAAAGGEVLAETIGRLVWPTSGRIVVGEDDILTLPESVSGRAITYVGGDPYFFFGTLRDNLFYGLKHAPLRPSLKGEEEESRAHKLALIEAGRAGTPIFDIECDWIDYSSAGAEGPDDLVKAVEPVLDAMLVSQDIQEFALRATIDPRPYGDFAEQVVEMRGELRRKLAEEGIEDAIAAFEPDAYNIEATVGENLLFGNAIGAELSREQIGKNEHFRNIMRRHELHLVLFEMGAEIARQAIELFGDLPPDHPFFQQLAFMTADDIPRYQVLLQKVDKGGFESATPDERAAIIGLSFAYIEPRHRFGLLTDELRDRILAFRRDFREELPEDMAGVIEFYDPEKYTDSASLLDNVLFGRISQKLADGTERVHAIVRDLMVTLGHYEKVLAIGLDYHVGAGGKRLTGTQRQKLSMARALMRRSPYYVFNRPLSNLDFRAQQQVLDNVLNLLAARGGESAVVWVLSNNSHAEAFDRVLVFDQGALVEDGSHATLAEGNGAFRKLISA